MGNADKSKAIGMFGGYFGDEDMEVCPVSPKVTPKKTRVAKEYKSRDEWFEEVSTLLREKDFDLLTYQHWIYYFIGKAKQHKVTYQRKPNSPQAMKEAGIMKGLMKNYSPEEIKSMIDFVWDVWKCPKGMYKQTLGIWILSGGWINQIYQLTQMWVNGEYNPKDAKSSREWDSTPKFVEEETTSKPTTKRTVKLL